MNSAKYHRTNFNPPIVISFEEADFVLDVYIHPFNKISKHHDYINK